MQPAPSPHISDTPRAIAQPPACAALSLRSPWTARPRLALALALAGLVAGLTACASDDTGDGEADAGGAPPAAVDSGPPPATVDAGDSGAPPSDADTRNDAGRDGGSTGDAGDDAAIGVITDNSGEVLPDDLAQTGLYRAGSISELAPGVSEYEPRYVLWSDGASKRRFFQLPEGTQIDTSDMDAWRFPVGTKAWKEFSRDGKKLETRLLWKTEIGWFRMAFAWDEAELQAVAVPDGVVDARGTPHDIPPSADCETCHAEMPDRLLGLSAIQLSHDPPGLTFAGLAAAGKLSTVATTTTADHRLPAGDAWEALGYVHANCGNCHNALGNAWDRVDMDLWLTVDGIATVEETTIYRSTVNVDLTKEDLALDLRIVPGNAEQSGVYARMNIRGEMTAMPPLASDERDQAGLELVGQFIDGL